MGKHAFWIGSAVIVIAALALREWFVLTAWAADPASGEAANYLRYAQHLAWDGIYTMAGNGQAPTPDAFRSPGYPWLLRLTMRERGWFDVVYQVQVLLGTATVAGVIALARQWLTRGWALLAGALMALQPHNIAAAGALLPEVLLGACIVGGLLAAACAFRRRSLPLAWSSGALLGLGYLVQPVVAFLPFLLALLFGRARMPRHGLAIALMASLAIGGWFARNALVDALPDTRVQANFIQGAIPDYHDASRWQRIFMRSRYQDISREVEKGSLRPALERMAGDPWKYLQWYAGKPYLLWDWDVRVGKGGIYVVRMEDSPLDRGLPAFAIAAQSILNPLLFCLAFCGLVLGVVRGGPERMVAVAVAYFTALHVVLQAEPLFAIPYRSLQLLLAVSALAYLSIAVTGVTRRSSASAPPSR